MKRTTTLYLDDEKVAKLQELGYVPSRVVDATMDIILSNEFEDLSIQLKLRRLEEELEERTREWREYVAKAESIKRYLDYLTTQHNTISEEWEKTKLIVRQTQLLNNINRVIIAAEFQVETARDAGREFIEKLMVLNPDFNLEAQIKKLKVLIRES